MKIGPQPGKQTEFLSCKADITLYGGEAGAGKTYGLLLECLRHIKNPQANAVIFRRTTPQIKQPGGLWDGSKKLYPKLGAKPNEVSLTWTWPNPENPKEGGYYIKMSHLQYADDVEKDWDGAEIPLIIFDELRHFTKKQFFYLLTRNRTTCGIQPYVRCTTNPDPIGWLREFLDWYIGPDGHIIPERSGVIRYFVNLEDQIYWGDTRQGLIDTMLAKGFKEKEVKPKSFTFIHGTLDDNPALLKEDPNYLANILAQPKIVRERLQGNWNAIARAGAYFSLDKFEIIGHDQLPAERSIIRWWDFAGTEKTGDNNPDSTQGVKLSKDKNGIYYIEHVEGMHFLSPGGVERLIMNTAELDGLAVAIGLNQDPGQAGKQQIEYYQKRLARFNVVSMAEAKMCSTSGTTLSAKEVRASPVSSQASAGNIKIVKGEWNAWFLNQLVEFPVGRYKDGVDALSGGFFYLTNLVQYDPLDKKNTTLDVDENPITFDSGQQW